METRSTPTPLRFPVDFNQVGIGRCSFHDTTLTERFVVLGHPHYAVEIKAALNFPGNSHDELLEVVELLEGGVMPALLMVLDQTGWRGRKSSSPDLFQCEFCGEEEKDSTLINHKYDCIQSHLLGLKAKVVSFLAARAKTEKETEHAS